MTGDPRAARILKAYNYNCRARTMGSCNHAYMGSMATFTLIHTLGSLWPDVGVEQALSRASSKQLDAGLAYCAPMLKNVDRAEPCSPTPITADQTDD